MKKLSKKKSFLGGFTLIELTISIAIIGILSTIIIVSLNSARQKSRDAKRVRNIEEIRTAIELYIAGHGNAPDLGDSNCSVVDNNDPYIYYSSCHTNDFNGTSHPWSDFESQIQPYMKTVPKDPCGLACYDPSGNYKYRGYFTYTYQAPGTLAPINNPPTTTITSSSYRIYAQNLEKGNPKSFGFGPGSF